MKTGLACATLLAILSIGPAAGQEPAKPASPFSGTAVRDAEPDRPPVEVLAQFIPMSREVGRVMLRERCRLSRYEGRLRQTDPCLVIIYLAKDASYGLARIVHGFDPELRQDGEERVLFSTHRAHLDSRLRSYGFRSSFRDDYEWQFVDDMFIADARRFADLPDQVASGGKVDAKVYFGCRPEELGKPTPNGNRLAPGMHHLLCGLPLPEGLSKGFD